MYQLGDLQKKKDKCKKITVREFVFLFYIEPDNKTVNTTLLLVYDVAELDISLSIIAASDSGTA